MAVAAAAGVVTLATVTGCGADKGGGAAGASSTASSSASSSASSQDLAKGLLPAGAFGADASVTSVTAQQLQQGSPLGANAPGQGATISPQSCADLVAHSQPAAKDMKAFAGEVARQGTQATVEMLGVSSQARDAVAKVGDRIAACPQVTITSPQGVAVTMSFQRLDVPKLGDGSAGISFTMSLSGPNGKQTTVPGLVALAVDGNRLVGLFAADPQGGQLDQGSFTALLQKAYQVQADKLD